MVFTKNIHNKEKRFMKDIIKKYFAEKDINSITLTDKGDIVIKFNPCPKYGLRTTTHHQAINKDLSKSSPELHEVKEYLKNSNKSSLTYSELEEEQTKQEELPASQNKTSYLL